MRRTESRYIIWVGSSVVGLRHIWEDELEMAFTEVNWTTQAQSKSGDYLL
jgi:hypothetical protein